jgi:Domain of unknown function (DUF309)
MPHLSENLQHIVVVMHNQAFRQVFDGSLKPTVVFHLFMETMFPPEQAVETISALHPSLIIAELDQTMPTWLPEVRSSPATRRCPVITVGDASSAVAVSKAVHANAHYTLNEFTASSLSIISLHAKPAYDPRAISDLCREPLPALVIEGMRQFNAGQYYDAHETLEHAWIAEKRPIRDSYRAMLQIAVAYYHITNGNYEGAIKMFQRSRQWLVLLPDQCQGINIADLRQNATAVETHLRALGPEGIQHFDHRLLRPLIFNITG